MMAKLFEILGRFNNILLYETTVITIIIR